MEKRREGKNRKEVGRGIEVTKDQKMVYELLETKEKSCRLKVIITVMILIADVI